MTAPPPIDPRRHALFLDFDGTLVDLVDDPAAVRVGVATLDRLQDLQSEADGALAIVSGRRIADLDRFLDPLRFAAAGVHGLERRRGVGAAVETLAGPEVLDAVRQQLTAALSSEPRLQLEDKGTALVLHYRTAPDLEAEAKRLMQCAVAGRDDLVVMQGNRIVEVHPAGMDKGRAVEDLMRDAPFAGRMPVYAGDDVTDEFALARVEAAGGIAIKVGPATSVAPFRLADVAALHRWLGIGKRGQGVTC